MELWDKNNPTGTPHIANRDMSELLWLFKWAISQMHERGCIIKHRRNLHSFTNRKHLENLSCMLVCIPLFLRLKVESNLHGNYHCATKISKQEIKGRKYTIR